MFPYEEAGFVLITACFVVYLVCLVIMGCREDHGSDSAHRRPAAAPVAAAAPPLLAPAEGRPPVAARVVVLGHFSYSAEGEKASEDQVVCAICLDVFADGDACSEVPTCRHLFHRDCVDAWMKSKTTCPLCRRSIVMGSETLSAAEDMV